VPQGSEIGSATSSVCKTKNGLLEATKGVLPLEVSELIPTDWTALGVWAKAGWGEGVVKECISWDLVTKPMWTKHTRTALIKSAHAN
jgi:hypothetical protein